MRCNCEYLLLAVVEEQNQQTTAFTEDSRTLANNAACNVSTTDDTLRDIDESDVADCSRRLFEPFHTTTSLSDTAGAVDQRNARSHLQGARQNAETTDSTQTSAAASHSLLQSRG